jgi:putative component of toxin-antitoxin plasmid stabilization module
VQLNQPDLALAVKKNTMVQWLDALNEKDLALAVQKKFLKCYPGNSCDTNAIRCRIFEMMFERGTFIAQGVEKSTQKSIKILNNFANQRL